MGFSEYLDGLDETEERPRNVDRELAMPADFCHGDHAAVGARISFRREQRFKRTASDGPGFVVAEVVVRCSNCCWNARARHQRDETKADPIAFFTEKAVAKVLLMALNNFKSKVPKSCADSLAAFVMTS